jgi:hypothetical protein
MWRQNSDFLNWKILAFVHLVEAGTDIAGENYQRSQRPSVLLTKSPISGAKLAHSASFHSMENFVPSNAGTEQLGRKWWAVQGSNL